jgi:hypothetical protein
MRDIAVGESPAFLRQDFTLAAALILLTALPVSSQTIAWTTETSGCPFGPPCTSYSPVVKVIDVDSRSTLQQFDGPSGLCNGGGTMSPDRSSYFVLSGLGLARFDVRTRRLVEVIAAVPSCNRALVISPDNRRWHIYGSQFFGETPSYRIIDAITRQVIYEDTSAGLIDLKLSADGLMRYELRRAPGTTERYFVRAVADSGSELWNVTLRDGSQPQEIGVGEGGVYVGGGFALGIVVRLSATTGEQLSEVNLADHWGANARFQDLAVVPGQLLVTGSSGDSNTNFLGAFDLETLSLVRDTSAEVQNLPFWQLFVTPDGASGYVWYAITPPRFPSYGVRQFDTATLQLTPERTNAHAPSSLQFEEDRPPDPVRLTLLDAGQDRVRLGWTPSTAGAIPTAFVVRGWVADRGGPDTAAVQEVPVDSREWTSPALARGAYVFEVIARNAGGDSPPSNGVVTSVGVLAAPIFPPQSLVATTRDRSVHLAWQPPIRRALGLDPSGYVVEAAPAGSGTFIAVARVGDREWRIGGVPEGEWRVRVRAYTFGGSGPPSEETTLTTTACTQAPAAATDLAVRTTGATATLAWSAASTGGGPDEFVVEATAAPSATSWVRVGSAGPRTTFQATAPAGWYLVRIRARNGCGESAASNEVVVVTNSI